MKAIILVTTAASLVSAISLPPAYTFPYSSENTLERRSEQPPKWMFANATTEDATADGSQGVIIEPDLVYGLPGKDGATVKKIKFGPYTLQPGQKKEFPIGAFGISPIEMGRELPCYNCYITAMQLNLEYEDGTHANVDTGAWLHHVDISVTGVDYTCPSNFLATIANGGDPAMGGRRIYAGGNERVPVRMNSKSKFGIDPGVGTMGGAVELMSEATKPFTAYVTMLFEYLPKSTPGYREGQLVWVDVTNCAKESDFTPQKGVYQKESRVFKMAHDGELVFAQGHMHDGGVRVELYVNGKLSCNSKQIYANRRGHYTEPSDGTVIKESVMPAGSHISDVGVCKDWGNVKKGDSLSVKAYFDETLHMQMLNPGKKSWEAQMGIMWTFVGFTS